MLSRYTTGAGVKGSVKGSVNSNVSSMRNLLFDDSRCWRFAARKGGGAFGKFQLRDFQPRDAQADSFLHGQFIIAESR